MIDGWKVLNWLICKHVHHLSLSNNYLTYPTTCPQSSVCVCLRVCVPACVPAWISMYLCLDGTKAATYRVVPASTDRAALWHSVNPAVSPPTHTPRTHTSSRFTVGYTKHMHLMDHSCASVTQDNHKSTYLLSPNTGAGKGCSADRPN